MIISAIPYGWSAYPRIGAYILGVGYVFGFVVGQQWKNLRWHSSNWLYLIMIALYVMLPLRQLFDPTPPTDYFLRQLHRHEWFLYVGLVGLLGFPETLKRRHVAYVMLLTSVFMLAHCAYMYLGTDEYIGCAAARRFALLYRHHISSHMVINLYINAALCLGLSCLCELRQGWKKVLVGLAMTLSWTLVVLTQGRIGLLASLLIIGVGAVYLIYRHNRKWALVAGVLMLLAAVPLIMTQPRMKKATMKVEPRTAIWDYSWRMVKQKPVFGYGLSSLSNDYVEQAYEDAVMYEGFIQPIIEQDEEFVVQGRTFETHHPHNAFLTYWLAVGIGGVLLLVALFVFAAMLSAGENRIFLWLFLLALFLQCMTEPIGGHLLPQFIALLLFVWEKTCNPDTHEHIA